MLLFVKYLTQKKVQGDYPQTSLYLCNAFSLAIHNLTIISSESSILSRSSSTTLGRGYERWATNSSASVS